MERGTALQALKEAVGPKGWLDGAGEVASYLEDERGLYKGAASLVLRPASTEEVSAVLKICHAAEIGVVPQGGNTGYVGGAVPSEAGDQIVVSLSRLNRIRDLDALNYTMTVEAGCVLADIQSAAEEAGRFFPLSLGAEGSCQIGGNISTNAGGTAVLRYGNCRDLVLGLEVVLPDGQVWNGLRRLRKDNTGYDLKQLFMGAEGTLGIITAAALKLFPAPRESCTALVAVPAPAAATKLLARLRDHSGDAVTSFEYMARSCLELVAEQIAGAADPLSEIYAHYVLMEFSSGKQGGALTALAEAVLAEAFEAGDALDAVIASSEDQARRLWRLRETIPEAQKHAGGCIKHDVSVPVSAVADFLTAATAAAEQEIPGVRVAPFGHLGDGNIHFNLTQPLEADRETFLALKERISPLIHDIAAGFDGSFSAEHGIGRFKRAELQQYKAPEALQIMKKLKQAFDPKGIMNPGKVL